jgi:hypothetical protein
MDSESKHVGPLTRQWFRILAGRDAAEDGPEVDIIRRARGIPDDFTFKTIDGATFCVREENHGIWGTIRIRRL